ncbi:hypothetical protein TRL7639_04544 [Falsiruegeria litorea R37]|uniref:Uncharacterized protein n=1 Tax=Falsiruegeria litorea R37 TaxID=1200284 RepID=A0A1Y5TW57_9RHOB|nr:hypothetical protein [Falsiruegeria litorea]SLN74531.1 hypothetical protein TRL7639_04544 [Falsiruegeria litorea R37]
MKFESNPNVPLLPFPVFFDRNDWELFALDDSGWITQNSICRQAVPNLFATPVAVLPGLKEQV